MKNICEHCFRLMVEEELQKDEKGCLGVLDRFLLDFSCQKNGNHV